MVYLQVWQDASWHEIGDIPVEDLKEKMAEKKVAYYNELAERAKTEQDAFGELYDYFFPRVYSYIFGKLKNSDQADDVISVTFEKVFTRLDDYDSARGAFSTWLFRIAINEMNNIFRKQKSLKEATWEDFFNPADTRNTPEQQMVSDEGDKYLLRAIEELPEREQKIVSMKYFAGVSNKEIAEMLDMNANNVGVVLHRALSKLRNILEAQGYTMNI